MNPSSDIAFTPRIKAIQAERGSRAAYARQEQKGGWPTTVTPDLAQFLAEVRSFYLGTATPDGQPYIQHRGGPPGFLHVLDDRTIAFADFKGNRQFITQGNLQDNDKAYIFLIDYATAHRIKIWGTARVIEDDPALTERLMPKDYKARPEQTIVFTIAAWCGNCRQHIPQRFEAEDVARALQERDTRIAELEAEIAQLRAA